VPKTVSAAAEVRRSEYLRRTDDGFDRELSRRTASTSPFPYTG
jgi:hypothetical protein